MADDIRDDSDARLKRYLDSLPPVPPAPEPGVWVFRQEPRPGPIVLFERTQ